MKITNAARLAEHLRQALEILVQEIAEAVAEKIGDPRLSLPPKLPEKRESKRAVYTVKEAALELGMSTKTVRRLIARKLLRSSKALSKIYIPAEDVKSFMERTS